MTDGMDLCPEHSWVDLKSGWIDEMISFLSCCSAVDIVPHLLRHAPHDFSVLHTFLYTFYSQLEKFLAWIRD